MIRPKRWVPIVVAAMLLGILGAMSAPATQAVAAGDIEFSRDGVSYSPTLMGGVFNQITITVPGDSQSAVFWIRNAGPVSAYLRIAISDVSVSDPILANALTVNAGTTAHPGTPATLASAQPCRVLTEGDLLAPGGAIRLSASLALGDLSGTTGQSGTVSFSLHVTLTDSTIPILPTVCPAGGSNIPISGGGGSVVLSYTGVESSLPWVIGASSIVGVGLFLLVAARRRGRVEE